MGVLGSIFVRPSPSVRLTKKKNYPKYTVSSTKIPRLLHFEVSWIQLVGEK